VSGNTFFLVFAFPPYPISIGISQVKRSDIPLVNDERTARVADLLTDFRTLQYWIANAPVGPEHSDDYYTEGYAVLRQCYLDGQHILNCAAETRVPRVRGGPDEQAKAELQQYVILQKEKSNMIDEWDRVLLDAYSRRHEAQKIYLRQTAAQNWIGWRDNVLSGQRPHSGHTAGLAACDASLRAVSHMPTSFVCKVNRR